MRALLLNGANQGDAISENICSVFTNELNKCSYEVKLINLHQLEIANCLGCFGCWIKTPGICVIDDAGRDVAKAFIQSNLVIFITPVTFGGYSYELKKAIDRLIPIISPFFTKIRGEVHHKKRYKKYPSLISVGIMTEMSKEIADTFKNIVTRNAINMNNTAYASGIILRNQNPASHGEAVGKFMAEVGVKK